MSETTLPELDARTLRSSAHAVDPAQLREAQRWQHGVTDLDVARVFSFLERGEVLYRNAAGSWKAPVHSPLNRLRLSTVIDEMIRTGLVRHYREPLNPGHFVDYLIPALVHMRHRDNRTVSACLFTGEDLGPMRARLSDHMVYVDCLACEAVVANGHIRGL